MDCSVCLSVCLSVRPSVCSVAWLLACLVARLLGCVVARLLGCSVAYAWVNVLVLEVLQNMCVSVFVACFVVFDGLLVRVLPMDDDGVALGLGLLDRVPDLGDPGAGRVHHLDVALLAWENETSYFAKGAELRFSQGFDRNNYFL